MPNFSEPKWFTLFYWNIHRAKLNLKKNVIKSRDCLFSSFVQFALIESSSLRDSSLCLSFSPCHTFFYMYVQQIEEFFANGTFNQISCRSAIYAYFNHYILFTHWNCTANNGDALNRHCSLSTLTRRLFYRIRIRWKTAKLISVLFFVFCNFLFFVHASLFPIYICISSHQYMNQFKFYFYIYRVSVFWK